VGDIRAHITPMTIIPRIVAGLLATGWLVGVVSGGAAQAVSSGDAIAVPLTPDRWTVQQSHTADAKPDTSRFETHLGRPSLLVPDGFAFASGVALRNGTIEADVRDVSQRAFMGLAFHVASPDQFEVVFLRPGAPMSRCSTRRRSST